MANMDVDTDEVPAQDPAPAGNKKRFEVKKWNAVALW